MSSTCLNDDSFGPGVQGCRGDFDFTQKFERIFFSIIPTVVFIAATFARVTVLSQRERIVSGIVIQSVKIVSFYPIFLTRVMFEQQLTSKGISRCVCNYSAWRAGPCRDWNSKHRL
jgi:hypothetical protein